MHIALKKLLFFSPGKHQESTEQNTSPLFISYFTELSKLSHFSGEKNHFFSHTFWLSENVFVLIF